jgi:hypothetical protein
MTFGPVSRDGRFLGSEDERHRPLTVVRVATRGFLLPEEALRRWNGGASRLA